MLAGNWGPRCYETTDLEKIFIMDTGRFIVLCVHARAALEDPQYFTDDVAAALRDDEQEA